MHAPGLKLESEPRFFPIETRSRKTDFLTVLAFSKKIFDLILQISGLFILYLKHFFSK